MRPFPALSSCQLSISFCHKTGKVGVWGFPMWSYHWEHAFKACIRNSHPLSGMLIANLPLPGLAEEAGGYPWGQAPHCGPGQLFLLHVAEAVVRAEQVTGTAGLFWASGPQLGDQPAWSRSNWSSSDLEPWAEMVACCPISLRGSLSGH